MSEQIPFAFDVPSVSELTGKIKHLLESNFMDVLVEGEISNVNRSSAGHWYFTIKDENAQLPCVIWRSAASRLDVQLTDGQQVVLGGSIQLYAPHGRYQLIVTLVQQAGVGALQRAYENLKLKLQQEGLFDDVHKKKLPVFPMHIGVVTSSTGAAFQDIRSTLERRWPIAKVYLYHAAVQGVNSAPELVKAIKYFSTEKNLDVLIIGRGGGSLEDLWPFNEEAVARAVFECPVPIISAVGHEVDFSISDFVADARAATPTQAAVMATPDINEVRFLTDDLTTSLHEKLNRKTDRYRELITRLSGAHALLSVDNRIKNGLSTVEALRERMRFRFTNRIQQSEKRVQSMIHKLEQANPKAPLERGFTRVLQNGEWVRSFGAFDENKAFDLEWKDSKITVGK